MTLRLTLFVGCIRANARNSPSADMEAALDAQLAADVRKNTTLMNSVLAYVQEIDARLDWLVQNAAQDSDAG